VGVDVEVARRPIDHLAIAERFFEPPEARRLARLDPARREREFLRLWTRHEAKLKCRGTSIVGSSPDTGLSRTWIAELEVGLRAAGALALDRRPEEVQHWARTRG
jgi:phosphopantetheinyl transferase